MSELIPMRWPGAWKDPSLRALLKGTALTVVESAPPVGVTVVEGVWPGVKMARSANQDQASAGPTGVPWVDSNGWRVRLARASDPNATIWVNAKPDDRRRFPVSYLSAIADIGAYGGRWIITLDDALAEAIAARKPEALATWNKIVAATGFFSSHSAWQHYAPQAVLGVISDFACDLRIASDQAKFGTAYAKIAFGGDFGITWLLTKYAGAPKAKELLFLADTFDAGGGYAIGIVEPRCAARVAGWGNGGVGQAVGGWSAGESSVYEGEREPGGHGGLSHDD
jgi:Enoyl-CoA hydratase/isomerase